MPNAAALTERYLKDDEFSIDGATGALLQHEQGRKFLWWLLEVAHIGHQPFSADPLITAFNCGELNIGQQVLSRITSVSPEGYVAMMKEKADERTRRDRELAAANGAGDRGTEEPDYGDGRDAEG